ncbi:MAG: hypothetical protein M1812_002042 [Candelaria pacifica]|nr:MAG: hypothetical protein M1812_002042 [Candelaria pacifica]
MPDDSMELSSDFIRQAGTNEDIEIDLDLTEDQGHETDNDYMIEDAKSEAEADNQLEAPPSVNDDLMLDEDAVSQTMQDDVTLPDEELYDIDILEHDESTTTITGPNDTNLSPDAPIHITDLDSSAQELQQDLIGQFPHEGEESVNPLEVDYEEPHRGESAQPQEQELEAQVEDIASPYTGDETQSFAVGQQQSDTSVEPLDTTSKVTEETYYQARLDADTANADNSQHETNNEILTVHPVVIVYQGREMSLFPPSNQDSDTFFLEDETLAHGSIGDLLKACRSILAEDVAEDDELTIAMAELGLYISEDSTHAPTVSLSQILDIHVQLLQQDGVESPDPLYMTLSTKERFSKRYDELAIAAAEGRGMSQVRTWVIQGEEDYGPDEQPLDDDGDGELDEAADDRDLAHEDTTDEAIEDPIEHSRVNGDELHSDEIAPSTLANEPKVSNSMEANKETEDKQAGLEAEDPKASLSSYDADTTNPTHTDSAQQEAAMSKESNAQSFQANHQHVTNVVQDAADEDDLVDYSDEEYEVEKNPSTGTSTLQGDDGTVTNGTLGDLIEICYRPDLCFCSICNNFTEVIPAVANDTDQQVHQVDPAEGDVNVHPTEEPSYTTGARSVEVSDADPNAHGNGSNNIGDEQDNEDDPDQYYEEESAEELLDHEEIGVEDPGPAEIAEEPAEPGEDGGAEAEQLRNAYITESTENSSGYNGNETSELHDLTTDPAQYIHDAQDGETNGEPLNGTTSTFDHVETGSNLPDTGANQARAKNSVSDLTTGNSNQQDRTELLVDEDEVNYDEEEGEVVTPNSKVERESVNPLKKPTDTVSSSKRSHDESLGQDEGANGSQDPKRVRSG